MSELWGFQAGQSIRRQEDDKHALAQMALRTGEAEIRRDTLAADASEIALQSQRKMLELMQGRDAKASDQATGAPPLGGVMESTEIPDGLDSLAKMALQSGLPQQASEYAAKASTIRSNASEIRTRETADKLKNLQLASNLLYNVHDEASWNQANALFEMTTGKPSPFAKEPYSPELVDNINAAVTDQKKKAETDAALARADASVATAKVATARLGLINAQKKLTETRDTALRKVGAVGKIPKAEDLRTVSDLINSEYMGAVTPEDARILARPIAERMTQLMTVDSLTRSQAAQRAFLEAQASGTFGGLRKRNRLPGSTDHPLEIPVDKSKLRPNMYYAGKGKYAGQTLLWTGTGFKLAAEALPPVDAQGEEVFDNEHTSEIEE